MKNKSTFWIILTLGLLVQILPGFSQTSRYWLKRKFPHLVAENSLWVGTPGGLYQYHFSEDSWSIYGKHTGLPDNDIQVLQWDGEFLWVITAAGLAYGDIKLNKWMSYTTENGLPSNRLFSLACDADYVWVATDNGAARFDKIIQEWELFTIEDGLPDSTVYDIVVDGDFVYFATASGLTEYEVNFEKWRYYGAPEGIPSDTIRFIYPTTDYLWLFTDQGPCRFNKKLHTTIAFTTDSRLHYANIRDLLVENEKFWVTTSDGVVIYDPGNNIWRNFQEEVNLPSPVVNALTLAQGNRWFVTDAGVAVFDDKTKIWKRYDQTHGLTSDQYEAIAVFMGQVFLMNANTIDYLKTTENRWYVYPLKDLTEISSEKDFLISMDREKGTFIQFKPEVKFSLSGSRFTYRHQLAQDYQFASKTNSFTNDGVSRGDLKAQLTLPNGRTINAFYNNTDYDQVLYGTRYKGKKGDLVQEVNWGDVRYEQGKNNLIPSIGVFGGSARLEAGPKTDRYKRSLVAAKGWSGEKTTGAETEFFTGNLKSGAVTLQDIDYIKNSYFLLDSAQTFFAIKPGSETIYLDDGNPLNNTANTLENTVIADIEGDFDRLQPYLDYRMNATTGEIQFLERVAENTTVVVLAETTAGMPVEKVIKQPGEINLAQVNRYFLGGMEIIPHTFQIEIYDSLGNRYQLAQFGIDANHDGVVDAEWIDYKHGLLTFPATRPFPTAVYATENPVASYQLKIRFQSEISILNLRYNHLIRGSEVVTVDGEILSRGQDYVLDYTSGSLLIIKEGILAEDSEIEVSYEFYRDTREKFHLAGVGFGPSDNVLVEMNYFAFDEEQPDEPENLDHFQGYNLFSELKWQIKNVDFKLTPEFAHSQGADAAGNSLHLRADISTQKLRLFSTCQKYDQNFKPLIPKKFKLGQLFERLTTGGTWYLTSFLEANANWKKQSTAPQPNGTSATEENVSGKILFSKNLFPAISVAGLQRTFDTPDSQSTKTTFKGDVEYNVPRNFLKKLALKSLRVYGVWRQSRESLHDEYLSASLRKKYDTHYLLFDFSPIDLVQMNAYFRQKRVSAREENQHQTDRLLQQQQKLFFDAIVDRIKGLNMNLRYQGELLQHFPERGRALHNLSINRSLQSNVRIFPGQWLPLLTPFSFVINYQPTWRGYLRNLRQELDWSNRFLLVPTAEEIVTADDNRLLQLRGEWRPSAALIFYSGIDLYQINSQYLDSQLETQIQRLNQKIEIRPTMNSLITIQYFRNHEDKLNYATSVRDNPMIWFENRWTERLQTKLNLTYWREETRIGQLSDHVSNFSPLLGLTYRIPHPKTSGALAEIRNDLLFSFYRSEKTYFSQNNNSISNTLAIDYFPTSVLILRLRLVTTYNNQFDSPEDNLSNLFEIRVTAQF